MASGEMLGLAKLWTPLAEDFAMFMLDWHLPFASIYFD